MRQAVTRILLVLAALLVVSAAYWIGWGIGRQEGVPPSPGRDTIRIVEWKHDTTIVESVRYRVRVDTVRLAVVPDTSGSAAVMVDSAMVEVPIEEKVFTGEDYRATVRGFHPELVDIWIKEQTNIVRITETKRWSFTVGPQVGIGWTGKGLSPYVGAGVTFGYSF